MCYSRKYFLFPDLISTYPRIDIFHWCDNKSQACWARDSWLSWLVSSTTMTKPTQSSSTWTNNWAQVVERHWRFASAHPGQHDEHVQYISKYHRGWHKSGCKQESYQKKTLKIKKHHKMNQLSGLTSLPTSTEEMTWGETPSLRSKPFELWCHFCLPGHKKNRFSSKGFFLFSWDLSVFVMWEKLRKHHLQNEVLHLEAGWNFLRHVAALVALLVEIQIFDVVHRYTPNTLLNKDTFCETKYIYIPSGRFIIPQFESKWNFGFCVVFLFLGHSKRCPNATIIQQSQGVAPLEGGPQRPQVVKAVDISTYR